MQGFMPRAPRRKVSIAATMRAGGPKLPVHVRDISARGMLVEAAAIPDRGSYVEIIGPGNSVTGRVVWARGGRFALRTRERLDLAAAAPGEAPLRLADPASPHAHGGRRPEPGDTAERSRHLSRHGQFAMLALAALAAASALATLAYLKLAAVAATAAAALG